MFSDEILFNIMITILTSTVKWGVARFVSTLWVTVTIKDEIFCNIKVSI